MTFDFPDKPILTYLKPKKHEIPCNKYEIWYHIESLFVQPKMLQIRPDKPGTSPIGDGE